MEQNNTKNLDEITLRIVNSGSYQELVKIIEEVGSFVSYSRPYPVRWDAEKIIQGIKLVRKGWGINAITRVCGLRAKVAELVLSDNYGEPWEEEEEETNEQEKEIEQP